MNSGPIINKSLFFLTLALAASGHAQMRNPDPFNSRPCSDVDGIVYQEQSVATGVSVELRGLTEATLPQRSSVENGAFHFRCVSHGVYEARVLDSRGSAIHSEQVQVGSMTMVHITVRGNATQQPASPWVSIRQLTRKTDRKAEGELRKAYTALEGGKLDDAVLHARKATERDPTYPQAFVMLGAACSRLDRNEEAAVHFSKAAELDPDYVIAHSNLAMVLLKLERYAAAEEPARRALKIASPLPQMHLALGVSLAAQGRNPDEAVSHFDRAANAFPRARLAAVRLLIDAGRRSDAASRLEEHLRTSREVGNRQELEALLSALR